MLNAEDLHNASEYSRLVHSMIESAARLTALGKYNTESDGVVDSRNATSDSQPELDDTDSGHSDDE